MPTSTSSSIPQAFVSPSPVLVGIDVGSTTVKLVAHCAEATDPLLRRYCRHGGRQAETVLNALQELRRELSIADNQIRIFMTGSGGGHLAELLGARFVQEVAAVSVAVEAAYPEVRTVFELGGQDAKMIVFQDSRLKGQRKKIASMNDKCAGGTGVVIEKIAARLHVGLDMLQQTAFAGAQIYPIAARCGVFAETDITGLEKQGTPVADLMASLFHAIVLQNLTVLARGYTLLPKVLLLGGPNAFFPGLQSAWREGLLDLWERKQIEIPQEAHLDELVIVPPLAEFFAAEGAIRFGVAEHTEMQAYHGTHALERHIASTHDGKTETVAMSGLWVDAGELRAFRSAYARPEAPSTACARNLEGVFVGLDGGSTSTKAVALSPAGDLIASSYRLSQSDPISDAMAVLCELREKLKEAAAPTNVYALGTTGYSKDLLRKALSADFSLVETVAHAKSSLRLFPGVDAIVDVGGQDIKIIALRHGAVNDFRLNSQCSAGNGYFLQAAAESLGISVADYADTAFRAKRMPRFSYGCAVFLQADIVNFQRQGWQPEEILAGLAAVLPKNVFLYVAGVSNLARLGRHFVLQGGTQRNLAVVKAEVDFIRNHYHGEGAPEVKIHPHCSEAGAIGVALHAIEKWVPGTPSSFTGLERLDRIAHRIRRDEGTRCSFCTNRCLRTFVEIDNTSSTGTHNVIVASCERGEAQNAQEVKTITAAWNDMRQTSPNYVQIAADAVWRPRHPQSAVPTRAGSTPRNCSLAALRAAVHIGIPKVLNLYTYAPLFSAYFESLGIPAPNLHYSHATNMDQYKRAAGFSANDPCFPSKAATGHVYELIQLCRTQPLHAIFVPMFDVLTTPLEFCLGSNACPSGSATPEAVKAAFVRQRDWFQKANVLYLNPLLNMADRDLFTYQMFCCWKDLLRLDWKEHARAVDIGFAELKRFDSALRDQACKTLSDLEEHHQIGLVLLGRPYHHDPGLNHGILEQFQRLGYPIFSQSLLPLDSELLDRLFAGQLAAGIIRSPLDIADVWKHTFSASSNHKLWAAKFVAHHPNLISLELSNFKCGHDAFISRTIEQIIERSGKPHFSFRDLDENRPLASIRIRIETIHYFLQHYRELLMEHVERKPPQLAAQAAVEASEYQAG